MADAFESRSVRRHYARPDYNNKDFVFPCAKDLTGWCSISKQLSYRLKC